MQRRARRGPRVRARGAGGPSRSGKCEAGPKVPRARPTRSPTAASKVWVSLLRDAHWHSWAAVAWARRCGRHARRRLGTGRPRGRRGRPRAAPTGRGALPGVRVVPSPAWAVGEPRCVVAGREAGDVGRRAASSARCSLKRRAGAVDRRGRHPRHARSSRPRTGRSCGRCPTPAHSCARAPPRSPAGHHATERDLDECERILGSVGVVVRVPEGLLDAVTGLSGSGPAYVFLVAEAMVEAGVLVGLPRETRRRSCTRPWSARRPCSSTGPTTGGAPRRGDVAGRDDRRRARAPGGARRPGRLPRGGRGRDPPLRGVGQG